jgi:hypothetical protein
MNILLKAPNPNNIFKIRNPKVLPPHYEYSDFEVLYNLETAIQVWIKDNLKGKFIVTKAISDNDQNKTVFRVGFEDGKELSYFALACPLLRYK